MTELSDLLVQWEDHWHRLGAPARNYLAPGTDPARVRQMLTSAGFAAPHEVVDWFHWHDGALVQSDVFWAAPTSFLPLSLDEALPAYREWREIAVSTAADMVGEGIPRRENPDFYWEPTWFPIARDIAGRVLALDLRTGQDRCPVHLIDAWATGEDSFRDVRAPSLAKAVRTWISWLDRGDWTWSTQQNQWQYDFAALPDEITASGLI